jgi:hypothetical protein
MGEIGVSENQHARDVRDEMCLRRFSPLSAHWPETANRLNRVIACMPLSTPFSMRNARKRW